MNCRYCGNVYIDSDRSCGGCGAPKQAVAQKLLDVPATPDHWSNSLKATIIRVLAATVVVVVLTGFAWLLDYGSVAAVVGFFWVVPVSPTLLTYAAWRDARGDWVGFFQRGFIVFWLWGAISFVVLMQIGISV